MSSTPSAFVFTNSPFLLSQVKLASFVPDIRQPHQDAKRPYEVQDSDYSVQTDALFKGQLDTSSKTMFETLATKFAWFSISHEKSNTLKVLAESGKLYSLNNPDDLFQSLVFGAETGPGMQLWLERCKSRGLAPRFVTAFRTFLDANISHEHQLGSDASGGVTVPISSALGDPLGAANLEISAGRHTESGVKASLNTPGERIYAICYRKIKVRKFWGSSATPSLGQTNSWTPFADLGRGEDEDEDAIQWEAFLSGGIGLDLDMSVEVNSASGEGVLFGTVSDSETFEE